MNAPSEPEITVREDPLMPALLALQEARPPPIAWALTWSGARGEHDPLSAAWSASEDPVAMRLLLNGLRDIGETDEEFYVYFCDRRHLFMHQMHGRTSRRKAVPSSVIEHSDKWNKGGPSPIDGDRCDVCVRLIRALVGDNWPSMTELFLALSQRREQVAEKTL